MKSASLILLSITIAVLSGLSFFQQTASAQEIRKSKEGWNWNNWVMKHQNWVRYHPKKAEYYENHPDAAQRFLNNWYRTHRE